MVCVCVCVCVCVHVRVHTCAHHIQFFATLCAGVQLHHSGIQPEEMDGVGNDDVASDS